MGTEKCRRARTPKPTARNGIPPLFVNFRSVSAHALRCRQREREREVVDGLIAGQKRQEGRKEGGRSVKCLWAPVVLNILLWRNLDWRIQNPPGFLNPKGFADNIERPLIRRPMRPQCRTRDENSSRPNEGGPRRPRWRIMGSEESSLSSAPLSSSLRSFGGSKPTQSSGSWSAGLLSRARESERAHVPIPIRARYSIQVWIFCNGPKKVGSKTTTFGWKEKGRMRRRELELLGEVEEEVKAAAGMRI